MTNLENLYNDFFKQFDEAKVRDAHTLTIDELPKHSGNYANYMNETRNFITQMDHFPNYVGTPPIQPAPQQYTGPVHTSGYIAFAKDKTSLVIPDAHVDPNQDLERFNALARLIIRKKPDNIVAMGDFVTLESLSAWDLGKAGKMEGRRYSEDCLAGRRALAIIKGAIVAVQMTDPSYKPRFVYILGNHEDRLARYVSTRPELAAHLDITNDLHLKSLGVTDIVPYRGFIELEGTLFTHAVMNAANTPVGGKTALSAIAQTVSKSVVVGHLHRFETINHYRHGADDIIQIVSAGGFFEHVDEYAEGGLNAYWRGVVLLHHIPNKPGRFDIEQISISRLKGSF